MPAANCSTSRKKTAAFQAQQRTAGHSSTSSATAGQFNNLLPGLADNPYRFLFDLLGDRVELSMLQFPEQGIPGVLWDCEIVLARYLIATGAASGRWQTRSVLELGAGTGLAAAVAWRMGAYSIATDLPEVVRDATTPNTTALLAHPSLRKGFRKTLVAAPLSWGNEDEAAECVALAAKAEAQGLVAAPKLGIGKGLKRAGSGGSGSSGPNAALDFVIAADVVYHSDAHVPLFQTLCNLIRGPRTVFIFVHRRRLENDSNFVDLLLSAFDIVRSTPVSEVEPRYPLDNLTVYEFSRKAIVS